MIASLSDRVERSFSRSFGGYHDAAAPQARIAATLVQALRAHGAPGRFAEGLELGCGTGHLTQRLCAECRFDALTLNDLSPKAEVTAQAVGARFLLGDASRVAWPTNPDLIASASMIQWLSDPVDFVRRLALALAPGGWLAISGFGPRQYRELAALGSSARAPGLCQVEALRTAVAGHLEIMTSGEAVEDLVFETPRAVLEHLRRTGVNGRAQRPWTRADLRQFTDQYAQRFSTPGGVSLTYHPIWIVARKPM